MFVLCVGRNTFRFTAVDKDGASKNFLFDPDSVELIQVNIFGESNKMNGTIHYPLLVPLRRSLPQPREFDSGHSVKLRKQKIRALVLT